MPKKTRHDTKILQSLRRIIRSVEVHSRKLSTNYQITTPQLVTLLTVAEYGPLTGKQIADKVYLSASTIVGILDRLEQKQLIVRKRDTKDRRLVFTSVTDKGTALVKGAPSPLQDKLAQALKKLPEEEQKTIASSLERIVEMMEVDKQQILETLPIN